MKRIRSTQPAPLAELVALVDDPRERAMIRGGSG
jgi:hypothetical protein